MFVEAFIVNVNESLKPFFQEQHKLFNIVHSHASKLFVDLRM